MSDKCECCGMLIGSNTKVSSITPPATGINRRLEPRKNWSEEREKKRRLGYLPGNSVSDVGERMKGGAVIEDKSPENEAILDQRTMRQRS